MSMLIFYVVIAVGVSFLCSILEAVILSITPSYLYSLKSSNEGLYKKLKPLRANIERPLAAILTLNTIAHTIGAAGAGAKAQEIFGDTKLAIFSAVLTFVILIFSEIIPKSIGARFWKSLLKIAVTVIPVLVMMTLPLVWISEQISKLIKGSHSAKISREEIEAIVDLGREDGALEQKEHQFLSKLLDYYHISIQKLVVPKEKMISLSLEEDLGDSEKFLETNNFSRYPVLSKAGKIEGYILRQDILQAQALNQAPQVKNFLKNIITVSDSTPLKTLFFMFVEKHEHIAAVVNDDKNLVGVITMEDILEKLLGLDIKDEVDSLKG